MRYFLALLILLPISCFAEQITLVTDIHAGSESVRVNNSNDKVYPKKALGQWDWVLAHTSGLVIALGDNINGTKNKKYQAKLEKVAYNHRRDVIYVTGNHDRFVNGNYYYQDRENYRLIVLNTNYQNPNRSGGINGAEQVFLNNAVNTDRCIIAVQHHPIDYHINGFTFAGHVHIDTQNGNIRTIQALTRGKGYNFLTINTNDYCHD